MAYRTLAVAAWLLTALTTVPCRYLAGQAPPSLIADVRTGFAGFKWGATLEEIIAARGHPAVDTLSHDFRRLVYRDTVDAKPVEIWYLLHPADRGLMAGQLGLPKPPAKCQDVYKDIRRDLEQANPNLKKAEEFKRNLNLVCDPIAGAVLGSWGLAWGDSGSARIQQLMVSGSSHIIVYYRGPEADAYIAGQRANRGPAIETFATFPWGTPRDSIIGRLGQPKLVDSTGGTWMLAYTDLLLGERASVAFTVSPVEGLIKGTYLVPVPTGRDCDVFFRKFHFALVERFADITPKLTRRNSTSKPFCTSVAAGTATLSVVWEDPKSGAWVTAELKEPGKYVTITYVGTAYADWLRRNRAADVKSKL